MKIVSVGKWPTPATVETTCPHCRTVAELEPSDVKYHENYDVRDTRERPWHSWSCPTCKHEVCIQVPASWNDLRLGRA